MVSAIILTHNEEKNIERCLEFVSWCDEIIVIDDFSTDKTIESVKRLAASVKKEIKIYKRHLNGDFGSQRNFGLKKATGEWVLFVDADEQISEELASEIKLQITNSKLQISGFYIKRKDYLFGKWLRYGETGNIRLLRLAKKDAGRWVGKVHEIWKVEAELKELENPILHYPHQTVTEFLKEINRYTDLVAQCWREQGRRVGFGEIIVYPVGKFLQNYFLRLGFLDGTAGLVLAVFMSFHSYLARSKYWLSTHK